MEVEVRFHPSGRSLRVPLGTTLLEAARRAGMPVASACGADGLCARCGLQVLEGAERISEETQRESDAKRSNRIDAAWRLACRARVEGPVVVTASYW